jgi:hypothetical protein
MQVILEMSEKFLSIPISFSFSKQTQFVFSNSRTFSCFSMSVGNSRSFEKSCVFPETMVRCYLDAVRSLCKCLPISANLADISRNGQDSQRLPSLARIVKIAEIAKIGEEWQDGHIASFV